MTTEQRNALLAELRAGFEMGSHRAPSWADVAFLLAELDAARAREQALARTIDRAWAMIENCYDVESRAECEASDLTHDGFLPIEMAIHAIGKRDPKVAELVAREAKIRAALRETPCHLDCADFPREKWCLRCAAIEGEDTPHV